MHVYRLAIALFVVSTNVYHVVGAPKEEEEKEENNYAVAPDVDIADIKPDPASEAAIRGWDTKYVSSSFSPDHDGRDDGTEDVIRGWNSNSQPSAELDLQDMRSLFQDMRSLQTSTSAPNGGGDPLAPPTDAPTRAPTSPPTSSPTTLAPTPPPTSFPSRSPVTLSPVSADVAVTQAQAASALTPPANVPAIPFTVEVPAEVSFNGIPCDQSAAATLYAASVAALTKKQCSNPDGTPKEGCTIQVSTFKLCEVESSISRRLTKFFRGLRSSRKLSTGTLDINFATKIVAYCQTEDCDDAADIIEAVEAVAKQTIAAATADDTSSGADKVSPLLDALIVEVQKVVVQQTQGTAATALAIPALLTLATDLGNATTAPADVTAKAIAPAVATLIAAAQTFKDEKDWYPNWSGSDRTCKNDGNAPFYMVYNGNWIKSSLAECCTHYYSWAYNECIKGGGGDLSDLESDEYYVDWENNECKQACDKKSTGTKPAFVNCGGIAAAWDKTYSDAKACCENHLWWIPEQSCVADSTNNGSSSTTVVGSGKWYIDHDISKCVKDCAKTSSDKNCGGLAETWEKPYFSSSSSQCCTTYLSWKERKDCTLD